MIGRSRELTMAQCWPSMESCAIRLSGRTVSKPLGIVRSGRVHWNLSPAALYEEALRRGEGELAAEGPLVCPHRPAHRPLAERQVRRPRAVERAARRTGATVNRPIDAAKFDALHRDMMAYLQDKELYVLDAWAGADPDVPAADPRRQRVRLAQPVRAEHVPARERSGASAPSIGPSSRSSTRRTSRPIRRGTARGRTSSSSCTSARSWC